MRRNRLVAVAASGSVVCAVVLAVLGLPRAAADSATGTFELVVKDAQPLRPGTTSIRSQNAFASRLHGLIPGNADGIEITFVTTPTTDPTRRVGNYAALVLYLDRAGTVAQVNLSYVVPGTTVARTVAWKSEDLKKYFSRLTVRGGRVALKSAGTFSEIESGHEALHLSWDVDVDLPLLREVSR